MTEYAAFLRGINVGGRVIRMADLKTCFEDLGFANVKTLLQSGNVLLESDLTAGKLKPAIEAALTKTFHYPARVQVLSLEQLRNVVDNYPFGAPVDGMHDYVIFMENGLEKQLLAEPYALAAKERVRAGDGVVYWRVDKGSTLRSPFAKVLAKAKYKAFNTNRNLNTLKKLI